MRFSQRKLDEWPETVQKAQWVSSGGQMENLASKSLGIAR